MALANNFGDYAEESWLINISRRTDRKERALAQCRAQGFEPHIFPAYDGRVLTLGNKNSESSRFGSPQPMVSTELCCTLSHVSILRSAWARGVKSLLILEDDIVFHGDFAQGFKRFWDEKPSDLAVYWGNITGYRTQPTPISEHVEEHHLSWLAMFAIYTKDVLDIIVNDFNEGDKRWYCWDEYLMLRAPKIGLKVYGPRKQIMHPFDHHGDSDIKIEDGAK